MKFFLARSLKEGEQGEDEELVMDIPGKGKGGVLSVFHNNVCHTSEELKEHYDFDVQHVYFTESPIAEVPSTGFVARDQYSKVSIQLLEWKMKKYRQYGNSINICNINHQEQIIPVF